MLTWYWTFFKILTINFRFVNVLKNTFPILILKIVHLWFKREALKLHNHSKAMHFYWPLSIFHAVGSGTMFAKGIELWICTFQTTIKFLELLATWVQRRMFNQFCTSGLMGEGHNHNAKLSQSRKIFNGSHCPCKFCYLEFSRIGSFRRKQKIRYLMKQEYDTTKTEDAKRRATVCERWLLEWKLNNRKRYSLLPSTKALTAQMSISGKQSLLAGTSWY